MNTQTSLKFDTMPKTAHKKKTKSSTGAVDIHKKAPSHDDKSTANDPGAVDDIVQRVKTLSLSPTRYPSSSCSSSSEVDRVEYSYQRGPRSPTPDANQWEEVFEFSSDEELSTPSDEGENGDG